MTFTEKRSRTWIHYALLGLLIVLGLELSLHMLLSRPFLGNNPITFSYAPAVDFSMSDFSHARSQSSSSSNAQIWFFGGSAVNAFYASDRNNIVCGMLPDEFAKILQKNHKGFSVYNFGCAGYNFNQERTLFLELLRHNPAPKLVIFYTGINDAQGNYLFPQTSSAYEKILQGPHQRARLLLEARSAPFKTPALFSVLLSYLWHRTDRDYNDRTFFLIDRTKNPPLSKQDNFRYNKKLIESVCNDFNIKCFFIVQAYNFSGAPATDNKVITDIRSFYDFLEHDRALNKKKNYLFLGRLSHFNKRFFFDPIHIDQSTVGNKLIAQKIYTFVFKK